MNCFKKARTNANLTQVELSARIHVTQGSISQWENGTTKPDFETLIKLADLYKISLDQLVGRNFPQENDALITCNASDEIDLIKTYRELSAQGQEYIRQQLFMAEQIYKKADTVSSVETEEVG